MPDAGERPQSGGDGLGVDARGPGTRPPRPSRCRGCARRGARARARRSAASRPTTAGRLGPTSPHPDRSRSTPGGRSRRDPRRPGRDGATATIVVALLGEDAQLRGHVVVKGAVPVEMIGLEIEQHGGLGSERLGVLELKRGCLADDRGVGGRPGRSARTAPCRRCRPRPRAAPPRGGCARSTRWWSSCRWCRSPR